MRTCRVSVCQFEPVGMGSYCSRHKQAFRRHGHPEQTGITSSELRAARRLILRRLKAHHDDSVSSLLEQQWRTLGSIAREHEVSCQSGKAYVRHYRQAYQDITAIIGAVNPIDGASEMLAVLIWSLEAPLRFKGHNALLTQIARRFYRLTDHHAGTYFDHKTHKVKRVYRDITPRVLSIVGELILEAFGGAAGAMFRKDQEETKQRMELNQKLRELA